LGKNPKGVEENNVFLVTLHREDNEAVGMKTQNITGDIVFAKIGRLVHFKEARSNRV